MRWADKQVVATQLNYEDVRTLDKLASKFSMSRAAMLRVAVTEFLMKNRMLMKQSTSGSKLADKIIDLLIENGDITN